MVTGLHPPGRGVCSQLSLSADSESKQKEVGRQIKRGRKREVEARGVDKLFSKKKGEQCDYSH